MELRYIQKKIDEHLRFYFQKNKIVRSLFDRLERKRNTFQSYSGESKVGWSFVIVTGGNSSCLLDSINSILSVFTDDDNFEIIVVGQNKNYPLTDSRIKYIPYHSYGYLTGWITLKKNIGAHASKFDKLVIMHDYIALDDCWKRGFQKFGDDFDVCTNRILRKDGLRARDWTVYGYPGYPGLGGALIPYSCNCPDYIVLSGAYFIVKKEFYIANPLDESLRWGESEDIEWCSRIRNQVNIKLNMNSSVRFLKDKPRKEIPYDEEWRTNTIAFYKKCGITIHNMSYENDVLLY